MKAKRPKAKPKPQPEPTTLTGWQQVAAFLGQPINVAQRWARTGMPVKRQGRYVVANKDELNAWLGREIGEPVRVATSETDLSSELKRGLAFVRKEKRTASQRKR